VLTEVPFRWFFPEAILVDFQNASRMHLWNLIAAPIGIIAIASAFLLNMPWLAKAILLACGIGCDVAMFFGFKVSRTQIALLRSELQAARENTRHTISVEPFIPKSGNALLVDLAEFAARTNTIIRVANNDRARSPYLFSFDNDSSLLLFRMKFVPENVPVKMQSEDEDED
jgi:hypothetical protein